MGDSGDAGTDGLGNEHEQGLSGAAAAGESEEMVDGWIGV